MGTNHIACYGVWRVSRRRDAARANAKGDTRWHRPYRPRPQCAAAEPALALVAPSPSFCLR